MISIDFKAIKKKRVGGKQSEMFLSGQAQWGNKTPPGNHWKGGWGLVGGQ